MKFKFVFFIIIYFFNIITFGQINQKKSNIKNFQEIEKQYKELKGELIKAEKDLVDLGIKIKKIRELYESQITNINTIKEENKKLKDNLIVNNGITYGAMIAVVLTFIGLIGSHILSKYKDKKNINKDEMDKIINDQLVKKHDMLNTIIGKQTELKQELLQTINSQFVTKHDLLQKINDQLVTKQIFQNTIENNYIGYGLPFDGIVKGNEEIDNGNYEIAKIYFKKELFRKPEQANAWVGIALAYSGLDRYEYALDAIRTAIHIDTKNPMFNTEGQISRLHAEILMKLKQFKEAKVVLDNEVFPKSPHSKKVKEMIEECSREISLS